MTWYDVKILGRRNGQLVAVDETVQAGNPEAAVQLALAKKFGVGFSVDIGWHYPEGDGYPGTRLLVFDLGEQGRFVTGHEQLSNVVAEADPVRVARLTGAPELPFPADAPPADEPPASKSQLLPSRFFRVTLRGETPDGRQVHHASTYRAWTHDGALVRAMEALLDVLPDDGRWVKGFAGPALSPRLKTGELFLELCGPSGPERGLTVEGSTLWDIVEEVSPPSWASLWPAPDAFQAQCLKTWGSAADTPREQRLHALLGLAGEVGEVANLVKKQLYKPGVVADNAAVIDELADVAYYLAVLAALHGATFDGLFTHLAGKLAGGHGWANPSNSTGLEVGHE